MTFYDFACEYVDMKWPRAAANSRRSIADALVAIAPVMLKGRKAGTDAKVLRKALHRWAFNSAQRDSAPDDVRALLKWAAASSKPLAELARPEIIRAVLDAVGSKLDGKAASVTYTARRRAVLWNLCEFAVEKKHLTVNPITTVKWARPKVHNADVVDPATVPNPQQAKALLTAVGELPGSGPRMVAFFACMYYAALRPGEAVDLTKANLHIPDKGRGKLYLTRSNPFAGSAWTDSGEDPRSARTEAPRGGRRPVGSMPTGADRDPSRPPQPIRHEQGRVVVLGSARRNPAGQDLPGDVEGRTGRSLRCRGGPNLTTRRAPVRPSTRGGVNLVGQRGRSATRRRLGGALARSPDAGLRQVPGRRGGPGHGPYRGEAPGRLDP